MNSLFENGRVIGPYRVVRCIGRGGMGAVYEVEHVELGVRYALKAFSYDSNADHGEVLKKKFLEEGRLLARLRHSNIIHVFDLGFDDATDTPYFLMDLILYSDGEPRSLENVGEYTESEVFEWFKDVCQALDHIHSQGVIHRDIKPANLLVRGDRRLVLTDLGVSRIFRPHLQEAMEIGRRPEPGESEDDLIFGTAHYMAPETAETGEAVMESDSYAVGVMFIYLLTGLYYDEHPEALAKLSAFKYRWGAVLPLLVAPKPERRPKNLTELIHRLVPAGATPAPKPNAPASAQTPKKSPRMRRPNLETERRRFDWTRLTFAVLFFGAVAGGGYYVYEQGKPKRQALPPSVREPEAPNPTASPVTVTNTVVRTVYETNVTVRVRETPATPAPATQEKRPPQKLVEPSRPPAQQPPRAKSAAPDEFIESSGKLAERFGGAIPKYVWFENDNPEKPAKTIDFRLNPSLGLELMGQAPTTFFMSNDMRDGKVCHRVKLTRAYWISKFCVTAEQWREFAPTDFETASELSAALEGRYPVYPRCERQRIDAFCLWLTKCYKSLLPDGYVFRLPTDAEWENALAIDETIRLYSQPGKWWGNEVIYASDNIRELNFRLVKEKDLSRFGEWETKGWRWVGWLKDRDLLIGGRAKPQATGLCDGFVGHQPLLDVLPERKWIEYADDETDPLRWVPGRNIYERDRVCRLTRIMTWERCSFSWPDARWAFHLVLGPDLVKEKAWENSRRNLESSAVPKNNISWNVNGVPLKISRPKKVSFNLSSRVKMIFCTIPKARFAMSNVPRQSDRTHEVELDYPYWMSESCVSVDEWREFGHYDGEGLAQDLKKAFAKDKNIRICSRLNFWQWTAYCRFLTDRFRDQLPTGYVFRLPTEAEFEWALVADRKGSVYDIDDTRFHPWNERFKNELNALLKKRNVRRDLIKNDGGWSFEDRYFLGGRTEANAFGIRDAWGAPLMTCETYDAWHCVDGEDREWDFLPHRNIRYASRERNPFHWDGRIGHRCLIRDCKGRVLAEYARGALAHIVIAPDFETPRRMTEESDYPAEDFGGVFLGDMAKVVDQSSIHDDWRNTPERHRLLLSRESVIVRVKDENVDMRGVHTQRERSPWVDVELSEKMMITGIQIDVLNCPDHGDHLRVWISDKGGKGPWEPVYSEDRRLQRYRVNLGKGRPAKYIRVGRERDYKEDWFSLNKILIYGKKK